MFMKTINITLLQAKFLLMLNDESFNQSNNTVYINNIKTLPYSIYKYYIYRGFVFDKISIYKYLQIVSIVKQSQQKDGD